MLIGIDLSLSNYALRLTRRDLCIVVGLLTGHGHADLNRHLTLMKVRWEWTLLVPSVKRKKNLLFISLEDAAHCQLLDLLS